MSVLFATTITFNTVHATENTASEKEPWDMAIKSILKNTLKKK